MAFLFKKKQAHFTDPGFSVFIPIALLVLCTTVSNAVIAQTDTLIVTAKDVDTRTLKPGTHRYLVYFKMGKDSSRTAYQLWSRTINYTSWQGQPAISVVQEWEDNDTVVHKVEAICDQRTFAPLYQKSWWRGQLENVFNFKTGEAAVGLDTLSDTVAVSRHKKTWEAFKRATEQYTLNWHLDLEVFPTLPYKLGRTFGINFYDPGFSAPKLEYYTVTGTGEMNGFNGQSIPCWLLTHESKNNKEVFWISKKTREVLKLDQKFGQRFRYKIKLADSI